MKKVNVVFGTVYGSAQFTAETVTKAIAKLGFTTKLWQPNELSGFVPPQDELLIVVSSTTGQGDIPEDISPWFSELKSSAPYLPLLQYSLIGLGDSSYETFCGAIKQFDELLTELGAKPLTERLEIDACETMEPEIEAKTWIASWHNAVTSVNAA
ncbi:MULTISPECIES: flavodoxin [Shewanella]|jgi:flavodoxin|uniref:Flavodoxin/nitric oxide synthase n=2 Tax=Shewanella frigidimarina TaxID=56812 RepID=Q085E9_SHEFN|nr:MULTISPECIES: flavodoxin [Shewanella]ABI71116.1 flavodoxin/nitric oxide synthase [Shewanella frigidimarina NCIMB 400]KVX00302.1 flavodoxin [Shewanella frigidimarina]MBB1428431.1 flavodoxin [Shewanella sp. SG44-2]PKH99145.1 flavodoxin [Shewanella sp. 11B5]RPA30908.1 flavodoxin [Shewanella frigidimarina]|tara:strand:- start:1577 stop:2041 length:465 start_codon:yes stop_codon:yes gene_type:complete